MRIRVYLDCHQVDSLQRYQLNQDLSHRDLNTVMVTRMISA